MSFTDVKWLSPASVRVTRDAAGLTLTVDGVPTPLVLPVRVFPASAPDGYIAFCDRAGHPQAMLEGLDGLDSSSRAALEAALADQVFEPRIEEVLALSYDDGHYHWTVRTNVGQRTFRSRQSWSDLPVTRTAHGGIAVRGVDGVRYVVPDISKLDERSLKLLFPVV